MFCSFENVLGLQHYRQGVPNWNDRFKKVIQKLRFWRLVQRK